jgi:hypothetical protein
MSAPLTPWNEGPGNGPTDLFSLFLFEMASGDIPETVYTEMSVAATAHTEMTAPLTTYTEMTL